VLAEPILILCFIVVNVSAMMVVNNGHLASANSYYYHAQN